MNTREVLFRHWAGCSAHNCVIVDNSKAMHTNGSCSCIRDMSRSQIAILSSRLYMLFYAEREEEKEKNKEKK